jgi:signal transduction histidine kinase/CheY-like chemotaxis protein
MKFLQRSLLAIGLAAATPALVFMAVQIFLSLQAKRHELSAVALARAKQVQQLTDAQLEAQLSALRVMGTSSFLVQRNWGELYTRIKRAQTATPEWTGVVLSDTRAGVEIFDTRRPLTQTEGPDPNARTSAVTFGTPTISGVLRAAPRTQASVYAHVPLKLDDGHEYMLTAAIDPQLFQNILTSVVPSANLAAVVDAQGNFIARNLRYGEQLGKPATHFVRDAIASGTEGVYRGVTHEGVDNYTAFYKSPWSGWSTHVAVAAATIDSLFWWSLAVAAIAVLATIALTGFLVSLVTRNMTELRRSEDASRQSQKMEAVGRLTAGIAHDFNNLLTAIIGNLDLIRSRTAGNERAQTLTANALEAARRAEKLTSRLLAFSREQRLALKAVDLSELLDGMSDLLLKSLGPRVTLDIDVDPAARLIVSDAGQLELALINLAVNARDAMPSGGKFSIKTRKPAQAHHGNEREFVEIAVSDTGVGMSEEVRARALEPFFTTKPTGQGTGLGLSQVFAFARASGGNVLIDSKVGAGSTIRVLLPAASEAYPRTLPGGKAAPPTIPMSGGESQVRILVVDDDDQVRRYVTASLRDLRYDIIDAANGAAALDVLRAERIDLLVVDFAMPGMNGAEVARAARELRPNLPILMISGYADTAAVESALGPGRLLRKPFNVSELSAAVVNVLQSRPVE